MFPPLPLSLLLPSSPSSSSSPPPPSSSCVSVCVFFSLSKLSLGIVVFLFILLCICWTSWIWRFVSFHQLQTFLVFIYSNIAYPAFCLSFSSGTLIRPLLKFSLLCILVLFIVLFSLTVLHSGNIFRSIFHFTTHFFMSF